MKFDYSNNIIIQAVSNKIILFDDLGVFQFLDNIIRKIFSLLAIEIILSISKSSLFQT